MRLTRRTYGVQEDKFTRDRSRSDVADSPELERAQKRAIHDSIEHLHGPDEVDVRDDELIVLTQVRNSRPYVKAFIDHYRSLGATHMVFLDNGSTDGTVEALKEYENVTVLRTTLPYRTHNVAMKQYLIERFGRRRWSLLVDIDELFDYPFSDVVDLEGLLRYLNENRYTAVVAHMLDMFPEKPISRDASPAAPEDEPLKEKYRFYDVSNLRRLRYDEAGETGNVVSNENIEILRGGIRNILFDNFNNKALLLKHPLIFLDDELKPMDLSDHWVGNARIADFTGVLYHYKFTERFYEDVRRSVEERNRSDHGTRRYGKFLEVLERKPYLEIRRETSKELESVDQLVADGFVVVSEEYLAFVRQEGSGINGENSELDHQLAKRIEKASQGYQPGKKAVSARTSVLAVKGEIRRPGHARARADPSMDLAVQRGVRARTRRNTLRTGRARGAVPATQRQALHTLLRRTLLLDGREAHGLFGQRLHRRHRRGPQGVRQRHRAPVGCAVPTLPAPDASVPGREVRQAAVEPAGGHRRALRLPVLRRGGPGGPAPLPQREPLHGGGGPHARHVPRKTDLGESPGTRKYL